MNLGSFMSTSNGAQKLSATASFNPPNESDWHRMISEAAYFIAARRNFAAGDETADWLAAEANIKALLVG
jgi:Protein of unknown function (DUF2934)